MKQFSDLESNYLLEFFRLTSIEQFVDAQLKEKYCVVKSFIVCTLQLLGVKTAVSRHI